MPKLKDSLEAAAMASISAATSKRWWLDVNGRPDGPHTAEAVLAAFRSGRIAVTTRVCPEGGSEWKPLSAWPEWSALTTCPATESAGGDLREVALWHRRFSIGILAIIIGGLLVRAADSASLTIFALLATTFLQVLLVVGLCRSMKLGSIVIRGIATAIPYLGLIPLFLVSRKATKRLSAAGIPVGLLGAKVPLNDPSSSR
jgi:hypothetical protein